MSLPLRSMRCVPVWFAAVAVLLACGSAPTEPEVCQGFSDWQTSQYVLPYPPGAKYVVDQGNCSPPGNGHRGADRYAYDFLMPIGTAVTVARAGTVLHVEESHVDGEIAATGFDNYVVIGHEDRTADLYGHLTHDGADVIVGQVLAAGAALGRSGNTGNTANKPHLHFSEQSCDPVTLGSSACPTLPVTFRNTAANPKGLVQGGTYQAN